jgi:translation initiation factor IF-3
LLAHYGVEDCIDKRFIRINDRIRAREVRVIGADGSQIGILPTYEAIKKAREAGLDLVEISPTAMPPVCRIQDYGKFLYEQGKKEKAAKKTQKNITLKEVKFSINVDEHDFTTKKNHVLRFIADGDKVKASLRFKGREMAHRNLGRDVLDRLIREVSETAAVEFAPRMEGNTMHAILVPKKEQVRPAKPKPPQAPPSQAAPPAAS